MNHESRPRQEEMSNAQYEIQNHESLLCQEESNNDVTIREMYEVQLPPIIIYKVVKTTK